MALEVVRHSCVFVCVMSLCLLLRASACVCLCVCVPSMLLCDSMHLEKGIIMLLLCVCVFCAWQHASVFARCLFGRVGDSVCNVEVYFACIERCPLGLGMLRQSAVASGIGVLGIVGCRAMQQCQALALTTSIFSPADQPGNKCSCQAWRGSFANIELARWRHKTLKTNKNHLFFKVFF